MRSRRRPNTSWGPFPREGTFHVEVLSESTGKLGTQLLPGLGAPVVTLCE
jgi:hypothetical protein